MARFRARILTPRGDVSRLGHASTGLNTETNGWDVGIGVFASVDDDGQDTFEVYVNGGSNGRMIARQIATVTLAAHGELVVRIPEVATA